MKILRIIYIRGNIFLDFKKKGGEKQNLDIFQEAIYLKESILPIRIVKCFEIITIQLNL